MKTEFLHAAIFGAITGTLVGAGMILLKEWLRHQSRRAQRRSAEPT